MHTVSNMTFGAYDSAVYRYVLDFNGTIALVFGLLSMYFTLCKSPPVFGAYKYFLFNIALWAFIFDVYMTILYKPMVLFPALVMCPTGLLRTSSNAIGYVAFWGFLMFFGTSAMAVCSAFLYRYAALKGKLYTFLTLPCILTLAALHFLFESPSIFFYSLGISDRKAIDDAILAQWPNIAKYYIGIGCAAIHLDVTIFPYIFMTSCVVNFLLGAPIVIFLVLRSFALLKAQRNVISPKTYRMHRQLLVSLIFQLIVPIFFLFGPFFIVATFTFAGVENVQWFMQIPFILGTFHSPMNTAMMLYFIPHYRIQFFKVVLRRNIRATSSSVYTSKAPVSATEVMQTMP